MTPSLLSVLLLSCADLSGNATLTSDYIWRGTSQTQGNPALQAGVKLAASNGLYASLWGSNVAFADARSEFDFTVGWSHALDDDWSLDANVLHYRYPSTTTDLDWTELNGTLTYRGHWWAAIGWSPDPPTYTLIGARFPISERLRLETTLAHYDDTFGNVSAIWKLASPLELRITAHSPAQLEAALQANF